MTQPSSARARSVSQAIHAAGLALALAEPNNHDVSEALGSLPTWYGHGYVPENMGAADVFGLIDARDWAVAIQRDTEDRDQRDLLRVAIAAIDAALLALGIDPEAPRERVAPVLGNIERFRRDPSDYAGIRGYCSGEDGA